MPVVKKARPADVINAAIIGKQRRHLDNSWEERVTPTMESGVRSGKWTADVRDGSDSDLDAPKREVRFAPINRHRQFGGARKCQ